MSIVALARVRLESQKFWACPKPTWGSTKAFQFSLVDTILCFLSLYCRFLISICGLCAPNRLHDPGEQWEHRVLLITRLRFRSTFYQNLNASKDLVVWQMIKYLMAICVCWQRWWNSENIWRCGKQHRPHSEVSADSKFLEEWSLDPRTQPGSGIDSLTKVWKIDKNGSKVLQKDLRLQQSFSELRHQLHSVEVLLCKQDDRPHQKPQKHPKRMYFWVRCSYEIIWCAQDWTCWIQGISARIRTNRLKEEEGFIHDCSTSKGFLRVKPASIPPSNYKKPSSNVHSCT